MGGAKEDKRVKPNPYLHVIRCLPEDHGAVLPVKGKIIDSDGTSATVNGRRQPVHTAVRRHQSIAVKGYLELSIHTVCSNRQTGQFELRSL